MADQWYYTRQGQRFGPLSAEQMKQLVQSGQLQPADLVWTDGMNEWAPAARFPQFFGPAGASAAPPAQAPTAASAPPSGPGPRDEGGGIFDLLDISFTRFVTTVIVRWLWILYLILMPIGFLIWAVGVLATTPALWALGSLVVGAIGVLITTLGVRVWLETVSVIFRIAEYLREMSQSRREASK